MRKVILLAVVAFVLLYSLSIFEAYRDGDDIDTFRLVLEFIDTAIVVAAIAVAVNMSLELRELSQRSTQLGRELADSRIEGEKWRKEAQSFIVGLGQAIRQQMREWGLSDSETDIALLMLKGLSHREIAQLRSTSEITVRQQARAIYVKSKLRNRSEFAAYFLEDITAPISGRAKPAGNGAPVLSTAKSNS